MLSGCLSLLLLAGPSAATDVVVVCPSSFRAALEPWLEHRTAQGHACAVIAPRDSAIATASAVRDCATGRAVGFVLLVGDAPPDGRPADVARQTPTHYHDAQAILPYGPESQIVSDRAYADLDADRLPDAAVGRLPVDSPFELERLIARILKYERETSAGAWTQRINLIAGVGGFGQLADAAIEAGAKRMLSECIPAGYATTMTYASWRSPYFPDPRRFRETAIDRFNEGCLFWVYMGHGQRRHLDLFRMPDRAAAPILSFADVDGLRSAAGAPIALFLSCYSGAFDGGDDCLAEAMLAAPEGPVAVVAGSRVTMPYGTSLLGFEMLHACFAERRETLGEVLVAAQRSLAEDKPRAGWTQSLDALASWLGPRDADLPAERREHALLFNLLGDPLLRLPHPADATIEAPAEVAASAPVRISGTTPCDGDVAIELVVRRDRLVFAPPARNQFVTTGPACAEYQSVYERANNPCLAACQVRAVDGRFVAELTAPADVAGECFVRVAVRGASGWALAAQPIRIVRAAHEARESTNAQR